MVYGNSLMNNIIAIICPDQKHCADALDISVEDLTKNEESLELKNLILKDLLKLAIEASFNGLEKIKYAIITFEGFTVNNNCMTPTMKIIRKNVELRFKTNIDEIYKSISIK